MEVTSVDNRALMIASRCPSITSLSLQRCTSITDTGLPALSALGELRNLCLSGTTVMGLGLPPLPQLTALSCSSCPNIGDAALAAWTNSLPRLCALHIDVTAVTNTGLLALTQVPAAATYSSPTACIPSLVAGVLQAKQLVELCLGPKFELNGVGLAALAACPALATLSFGNFNIEAAPPPGAFPQLTSLQVRAPASPWLVAHPPA
jgi:hypothetical protein